MAEDNNISRLSADISEDSVYEARKTQPEKLMIADKVKVSTKTLGKRSVKIHHNSELFYDSQHPLVKKFLLDTGDYFDIVGASGTIDSEYGKVSYLAKVIIGNLPCILIRDEKEQISSPQGRLKLANLLLKDWNKARLIVFGEDKLPMYASEAPCVWSMFEMPTQRRRFNMLCYKKYFDANLDKHVSIKGPELAKLGLVDMMLEFLQKGNKVSKGLNELEEMRCNLIRPERCFTDEALSVVVGLYLAECVNYYGDWTAEFADGKLTVKYAMPNGDFCFEAGRFALDVFKNPYGKANLPGCIRNVVGSLSDPESWVSSEYNSYLHWDDNIYDNLLPEWHYENLNLHGVSEDRPLFVDAHVYLNAERFEKLKNFDSIHFSEDGDKVSLTCAWWCSQCQKFTFSNQDLPLSRNSDLDSLTAVMVSKTSELVSEYCSGCGKPILANNMRYAAMHIFYDWPGADVCLELARLNDKRLVRGWGYINLIKARRSLEEAEAEGMSESAEAGASLDGSGYKVQIEKKGEQEKQLSPEGNADDKEAGVSRTQVEDGEEAAKEFGPNVFIDVFREFSSLKHREDLFFQAFGRRSSPLRFACNMLKSRYDALACGQSYDEELQEAGGVTYLEIVPEAEVGTENSRFEESGGREYFVLNADLDEFMQEIELCRLHGMAKYSANFWVDWSVFTELAKRTIKEILDKLGYNTELRLGGKNDRILYVSNEHSKVQLDLADKLTVGFYENKYPESVIRECAKHCADSLEQAEKVWQLADSFSGTGLVTVRFVPGRHGYTVNVPGKKEVFYDCSDLNAAPEGALRRARLVFSPPGTRLSRCRCGEEAAVCLRFAKLSDAGSGEFIKYSGRIPNIFIDPHSIVETEMAKRYNLFFDRREQVRQVSGDDAAAMLEFSSKDYNNSGLVFDANSLAYDKAFNGWFPYMDDLKRINAKHTKDDVYPVFAVRCAYHCENILRGDLKNGGWTEEALKKRWQRDLERLRGRFDVYRIDDIVAVLGEDAGSLGLDARLAVGVCKTAGLNIPTFFKVCVRDRNLLMLGPLYTEEETFAKIKKIIFRRCNVKSDSSGKCHFERACFCSLSRGAFTVTSHV
ncbi:hypothetical protein IJT93_01190 [bacterium]|nr:hypothetical protein [bacterium]